MTGYHISVGYNANHPKEVVGEQLLDLVSRLRERSSEIAAEAHRLQPSVSVLDLEEVGGGYPAANDGGHLRLGKDENGFPTIMVSASGGGNWREAKEAMARAFCRLVMENMHRLRMEVSISVS